MLTTRTGTTTSSILVWILVALHRSLTGFILDVAWCQVFTWRSRSFFGSGLMWLEKRVFGPLGEMHFQDRDENGSGVIII